MGAARATGISKRPTMGHAPLRHRYSRTRTRPATRSSTPAIATAARPERPGGLPRRTHAIGVGAEHAAVARARAKQFTAAGAAVEVLADVQRHRLARLDAAQRAGDDGLRNDHRARVGRTVSRSDPWSRRSTS